MGLGTQEQINQLEGIEFAWEVGSGPKKDDTLWRQRLKELIEYKEVHGDCRVPQKYEQNNVKLGKWVSHHRAEYKKWVKGKPSFLTKERVDLLEDIDFEWEIGYGNGKRS